MSDEPEVSILISVFEQPEYTRRCLEVVERTLMGKVSYEVVVVDDASQDGVVDYLRGLSEPHRVLFNEERKGFAINNNLAAREARGEFLCFLNNDVFVEGNWLLPMLAVLKDKKSVGMVGNVQRLVRNGRYDHMGVVFGPKGNPRHFGQGFFHRPFKGEVREWSAVTAACCTCRRDTFLEFGGFDEIYLNGCEDVDLCLQMHKQGLRHFVAHDSVVLHVKGGTKGRKAHNDRNAQILLKKWGDEVRSGQAVRDQVLHALTYLWRGLTRPWLCHVGNLLEALLLALRLKKLKK
jgi:GT2 family glycosyltransferase|tara:strand:+ start:1627 stop:2502 length:876 start_codon:yes stop_codon:yes gene_type:complete